MTGNERGPSYVKLISAQGALVYNLLKENASHSLRRIYKHTGYSDNGHVLPILRRSQHSARRPNSPF